MDKICCIINLEGFNIGRKFLAREFGWVNVESGQSGNVRFNLRPFEGRLAEKDRSTIRFTTNKLHGLQFQPARDEEVVEHDLLESQLTDVYNKCKVGDKNVVAYKGGTAEKNLLEKLQIPYRNLEEIACPKYKELTKYHTISACGYHKNNLPCSLSEVAAYRSWFLDNMHEFTE